MVLFSATIFLSAFLLFWIEPLVARMMLPLLGGSPAVWNTAMLFFQAVLLAGYVLVHKVAARRRLPAQFALQAALFALSLAFLPPALLGSSPPADGNPVLWVLGALAAGVGVPFLTLSTLSPLLQHWFSRLPDRRDPYVLYSFSNAGSLAALISYPLVLEPLLSLRSQARIYAGAFVLLLVLVALCARASLRGRAGARAPAPGPAPPLRLRARWAFLAFIPSSLVLSVTQYMTTDIASVPMLWTLPLAAYVGSFVIAFSPPGSRLHLGWPKFIPVTLLILATVMATRVTEPIAGLLGVHLLAFFVIATGCHELLAAIRPGKGRLTEFYFWLSLGGALGGVFNALLAPLLFKDIHEYPLVLVLAAFAVGDIRRPRQLYRTVALDTLVLVGVLFAIILGNEFLGVTNLPVEAARGLLFGIPLVLALKLKANTVRFGLALGAVLFASHLLSRKDEVLFGGRSFFGVHRVVVTGESRFHELFHGSTLHGRQAVAGLNSCQPLTYYGQPVRQVIDSLLPAGEVAVVGLGTGALACYAKPGQRWTFFEIDPLVSWLAASSGYFTFLNNSPGEVGLIHGDARLTLGREPDGRYSLIFLDAYSSDSIPVHLLTREAVALYLSKLKPEGAVAFHLSNRHFDLAAVLIGVSKELGLATAARWDDLPEMADRKAGYSSSLWFVVARKPAVLVKLLSEPGWAAPPAGRRALVWTDDYSAILTVLK